MSQVADLYTDYAGWIFVAAFALISVLLVAAGGGRLSPRWWIGAAVSGAIVLGLSVVIVMALGALDTGGGTLEGTRWWAIGLATVIGFVAGTDVQLVAALFGRGSRPGTVAAGVILGPIVVVGGYLLLQRTVEWARLAS
ncbi:MAG TPA: hypothetical protein VFP30_06065 [Candidatus Limnocylindria bacterium]|nr:hypothetical protein [Candidatus Limnocylindria bacterium]